MRALVVIAHPCRDSFSHALSREAVIALETAGHEVNVLDLYEERFRAAMSREERAAYHEAAPIIDPQVERHAHLVRGAEMLVFVYPTWWSGLPAILKGWLERVMVPGVGFVFDERNGKVRPGLTQVRRIVGISTYGSPRLYVKLVNDNGRRTLLRALRMSCGWSTRSSWMALYAMDTTSAGERREFLRRVGAELGAMS